MNKKKDTKKAPLPKLGFGAKLLNLGRDYGVGVADYATNAIGMTNLIGADDYKTGIGKKMGNVFEAIAPMQQMALQMGANVVAPGSGQLVAMGQQAAGAADTQIQAGKEVRKINSTTVNPYTQMMMAYGGAPKPTYEAEKGEVVTGTDVALEAGKSLASNVHAVGGSTHEQGGTDGAGGDKVFSDRIMLPSGKTPAQEAESIGKAKGRMEKKLDNGRTSKISMNTKARQLSKYDSMLEKVFAEQESIKSAIQQEAQMAQASQGAAPEVNEQGQPMMRKGGTPGKTGIDYTNNPDMFDPNNFVGPSPTVLDPVTVLGAQATPQTLDAVTVTPNENKFDYKTALDSAVPYMDNAVNAAFIANTPRVPRPHLTTAANLDTTYDISQQLNEMNNAANTTATAINENTANSSVSNANRQGLYSKLLDNSNKLYDQKQKVETQLENQDAMNKQAVQASNNSLLNTFAENQTRRVAGMQQDTSKNVVNAVDDYRQSNLDAKMTARDTDLMRMALAMNPDSPQYLTELDMVGNLLKSDQVKLKALIDKTPGTKGKEALSKYLIK